MYYNTHYTSFVLVKSGSPLVCFHLGGYSNGGYFLLLKVILQLLMVIIKYCWIF
jgi:hypothetical protein